MSKLTCPLPCTLNLQTLAHSNTGFTLEFVIRQNITLAIQGCLYG